MPQKLIRLTSDSGDGVFKGIFNQEIEIKEDSEIALQSLSVERQSSSVQITGDNNIVSFASMDATAEGNEFETNQNGNIIPFGVYDKSNTLTFFQNVTAAMNRVCNAFTGDINQWGIQHSVAATKTGSSGRVKVAARLSPFYQIQTWDTIRDASRIKGMSFTQNLTSVELSVPNNEICNIWSEFKTEEFGMWRESDTTTGGGGSEPEFNESYVYGTEAITKSTGAFRARFKHLNTDGAGTANFTMGLVKGDEGLAKLRAATFKLEDFHYAIRVRGHSTPIQYVNQVGSTSADFKTSATPVNYGTDNWTDQLNDVLDIRIGSGNISGIVTSQVSAGDAPIETLMSPMIGYDATADYYWVIAIHEGKAKCVLDLVGVTLDPIGPNGANLGTSANPLNAFKQGLTTGFSAITNLPIQNVTQVGGRGVRGEEFTPAAVFNPIVAKYMGFPQGKLINASILPVATLLPFSKSGNTLLQDAYAQRIGYIFLADFGFDNSYDSDTYIIDTQTFTLESYDSYGLSAAERNANSGGSRRNIIATIPVTEVPIPGTSNSIIQYEPSTQNYVQIKNRGDIVTRQIRCRLLSGMYQPVKTEGLASIVLLIKE